MIANELNQNESTTQNFLSVCLKKSKDFRKQQPKYLMTFLSVKLWDAVENVL